ncbi:MAG: hypothetical protein HQL25_01535 [Candidatus Omnitrophica bacterium]|nr:hypothetical protein [Candidatus Omnitrophota bacterium]
MSAQDNETKIKILDEARDEMSSEEFAGLIRKLRIIKIISKEVVGGLNKN